MAELLYVPGFQWNADTQLDSKTVQVLVMVAEVQLRAEINEAEVQRKLMVKEMISNDLDHKGGN